MKHHISMHVNTDTQEYMQLQSLSASLRPRQVPVAVGLSACIVHAVVDVHHHTD